MVGFFSDPRRPSEGKGFKIKNALSIQTLILTNIVPNIADAHSIKFDNRKCFESHSCTLGIKAHTTEQKCILATTGVQWNMSIVEPKPHPYRHHAGCDSRLEQDSHETGQVFDA
jgi:hypothetical protein